MLLITKGLKNGKEFRARRIESSALTSNGRLLKFKELIADEPHNEAGLAHGCIPKEDQLEVAYPISAHG